MKTFWNALAAIGSIIAAFYLKGELEELRRSNEIQVSAIRQTYRPLGLIEFTKPGWAYVRKATGSTADRIKIGVDKFLINNGSGLMLYLGSFGYIGDSAIDLRKEFLNGKINSVISDEIQTDQRRVPLRVSDTLVVSLSSGDLPFKRKYYLNILYLYEDQNGDLYDTEHLDVLPFTEPKFEEGRLEIHLEGFEKGLAITREQYHYYSQEEKEKLAKRLQEINSNLAKIF